MRYKSKKQIEEQAKRLVAQSSGNSSRKTLINGIKTRYLSNIDNQPLVKSINQRNDYLRSLKGTNPKRSELHQSYANSGLASKTYRPTAYANEKNYNDRALSTFIGRNNHKAMNSRFSRNQYMNGAISNAKASSVG